MSRMLALPVAIPLLLAGGTALARTRPRVQRVMTFAGTGTVLVVGVALIAATARGEIFVTQVGGWPPGFAVPFVADLFSSLMLTTSGLLMVTCLAFAAARGEDRAPFFHPLALVLAAGISGALLTADLFNLFVFFEVMLMASYVLMTLGGTRRQVRAGAVYVTTNLLASTLLVAGVALAYGAVGTVNMAGLAEAAKQVPTVAIAGGLLLVAFGVKASLVPVHGWLPSTYPAAPPAVAALFSGILTKVGIYAIYRVYSVIFDGDPGLRGPLLVVAGVTMVVGVLGAVGREGMRDILAFHMVSQVGYILLGLGLFDVAGVGAGIFYMIQYMVVKTSLFLAAGAVETLEGTGALPRLGGLARSRPVLATGFIVAALSLSGLPPLSGFFAKVALVQAAFTSTEYLAAATAIVVSFFTLLSMIKIWNGVFWGDRPQPAPPREPTAVAVAGGSGGHAAAVVGPAVFLAAVTAALGFAAHGLFILSGRAAAGLLEPVTYITAVLGR